MYIPVYTGYIHVCIQCILYTPGYMNMLLYNIHILIMIILFKFRYILYIYMYIPVYTGYIHVCIQCILYTPGYMNMLIYNIHILIMIILFKFK